MKSIKQVWTPVIVLTGLIVSGCAVMSVEECQVADWGALGYQHGVAGTLPTGTRLAPYIKACAKAGISPDQQAYEQGRSEGARVYCHPSNGFKLGRSGKNYNYICDPDLEAAFLAEYDRGSELFTYEEAVRVIQSEIAHLQTDRDNIQHSIADKRALIKSEETTSEERGDLTDDIYRLAQELGSIESDLDRLTYALVEKEAQLNDFKTSRGYY